MIALLCLALQSDLEDCIRRLGDDSLEVRDSAQADLIRRGESILPQLREARRKATGETAARLDAVIDEIRWWDRIVWIHDRAVDVRAGRTVWELPHRVAECEPILIDRDVIVAYDAGRVERRSLRDGSVRWERDSGHGGELALAGDAVLHLSGTKLRAWDAATGRIRWTLQTDGGPGVVTARLNAGAGRCFVLGGRESTCIDVAKGETLWKVEGEGRRAAILPDGDVLLVTRKSLTRHAAKDGAARWSAAIGEDAAWRLWVAGGHAIAGDSHWKDGAATGIFDLATGKRTMSIPGAPVNAVAFGPDLLVATEKGHDAALHRVHPESVAIAWRHDMKEDGVALLVEGERIYVAEYATIACGIRVRCLSAAGEVVWTGNASGVQVGHSEYYHSARLQKLPGRLVLLGVASGGDYVEGFSPGTGESMSKWNKLR